MKYVASANYTKPGDPGREGVDASERRSRLRCPEAVCTSAAILSNLTLSSIALIDDRVTALLGGLRADHPAAIFSQDDHVGQVETTIRQACCVCCATPSTTPLFRFEWVRPGNHITLVGSYKPEMAEVDTTPIRRARSLVDSCSAWALEAGELIAVSQPRTWQRSAS